MFSREALTPYDAWAWRTMKSKWGHKGESSWWEQCPQRIEDICQQRPEQEGDTHQTLGPQMTPSLQTVKRQSWCFKSPSLQRFTAPWAWPDSLPERKLQGTLLLQVAEPVMFSWLPLSEEEQFIEEAARQAMSSHWNPKAMIKTWASPFSSSSSSLGFGPWPVRETRKFYWPFSY